MHKSQVHDSKNFTNQYPCVTSTQIKIWVLFDALEGSLSPVPSRYSQLWLETTNLISVTLDWFFLFLNFIKGIHTVLLFAVWFLSLIIMSVRFLHAAACISSRLLFVAKEHFVVWLLPQFIHCPVTEHLQFPIWGCYEHSWINLNTLHVIWLTF